MTSKTEIVNETAVAQHAWAGSFPHIYHGGDYNPEQWPSEVWDDDVHLMREAQINIATLPVFGWVNLQPDEQTYTFDWLDQVIEKLTAGGIGLCLATATASTPAWLDQHYPDVLRVDINGRKLRHGGRHSFCPNSANFRRLAGALTRQMGTRYGAHDNLVAWHISNEYSNTCYCETCAAAFRIWLEGRYGSLDELNRRWYTQFWGHRYTEWDQIEPPVMAGERSVQALMIDYDRFQSASLLACCKMERDILRASSPDVPITTNFMGSFKPLDYQKWAKEIDIVSWDSYPARGAAPAEIAFQHSLMRGCKNGAPWMLMEQTPSQQNWQAYNALKRPGVMRLWSYQAVAHGADSVMYFQWRRSRGGCEKMHGAVVEHAGRTDARVFQEVKELGRELILLGSRTVGSRVHSKVALVFDWENWWAAEYSVGPSTDLKYIPQMQAYYAALHSQGIVADVVPVDADLSGYKVVVAPVLYMVKPGVTDRLNKFVSAGGTFVTTYFSGIVNEDDVVFEGGYPGPLSDLLGIWVEETDVLSPRESNSVQFSGNSSVLAGAAGECGLLCDRIHCEFGAQPLATYGSDFYAGEPAVTVNRYGEGTAYYLGTMLRGEILSGFLSALCDTANAGRLTQKPSTDLEVVERIGTDGDSLIFALNHGVTPVTVELKDSRSRTDLLTGSPCGSVFMLPKYGVAILRTSP